jgi:TolB-like protein/predicted Ser/Thr protein kinase
MIGKTISHYKILEKLGQGGMGTVYMAEDTKLDRTVALKFLTSQAVGEEDEKARFVHEAKAAAALSHPNVCHVYEIDESEGQTFIAMEYLEGQTLKEKINAGPLNLKRALELAIEIAGGLKEAHEAGIVHRDIKPANIMITTKGRTKITDFGLAKLTGGTKLTKTQTTLGTAPYMSPEQARGEETDRRTDIWSLGVVIYEMACGLRPFRGDYEPAVIYSILNERQEPLTALRTGVPVELERIVDKSLAKSPDERYQQVADMLVDLKGVVKRLESSERGRAGTGAEAARSAPVARPEAAGATTAGPQSEGARSAQEARPEAASQAAPRPSATATDRPRLSRPTWYVGAAVLIVALVIAGMNLFRERPAQAPTGPIDPDIIDSIAVLPLENISGDPTEDYFVAGMHEALITDLSRIGALRVISRTSVMRYKDTDKAVPEIARELDVDAIVEGSVMRVGDQVRITAQLIRAATDEHLWAENYDRELSNVLGLLSEVAQEIAGEIEVALSGEDKAQLADSGPVVPEAYDAYLRGQFHFNTLSAKELERLPQGPVSFQHVVCQRVRYGFEVLPEGEGDRPRVRPGLCIGSGCSLPLRPLRSQAPGPGHRSRQGGRAKGTRDRWGPTERTRRSRGYQSLRRLGLARRRERAEDSAQGQSKQCDDPTRLRGLPDGHGTERGEPRAGQDRV